MLEPKIRAMLAKMQPGAVAFNGCVVQGGVQSKSTCITPNSLRWIGTEAGVAPDPNWSTGFNKGGSPTSDTWLPSESDTTLQNGDAWSCAGPLGFGGRQNTESQDRRIKLPSTVFYAPRSVGKCDLVSEIILPRNSDSRRFYNNRPGDIRTLEELQAVSHWLVIISLRSTG